ncbi:MAG: ribosome biogenesis GTPase Der [Deltaproteobacteria bacterium]|jgi:GTP-binding protein|nr:ribosome biogenesis GTPase Der [Deltaproteobacteria bacterium]
MRPIIALIGRTNVGKSSLFNRLSRGGKSLVDDSPGVTRDRLYGELSLDGKSGLLVDTGGFDFAKEDPIAGPIAAQILAALAECDLAVFVVDGASGPHPWDQTIRDLILKSRKPALVAVNKIDGPDREQGVLEFLGLGLERVFGVSAAHGYGLDEFRGALAEYLEPEEEAPRDRDAPPRIAVIGRPNAGKSSMINTLLGQNRLLVDPRPGTTRDAVDVELMAGDKKYVLVDTAGVRRRGRISLKLEKFSVIRSLRAIDRADVALSLIDATLGLSDQDAHIAGYAFEKGKPVIFLLNKWDAVSDKEERRAQFAKDLSLKMTFLEKSPWFTVSGLRGQGLKRIFPLVDRIMLQYTYEASTSEVNKALEKATAAHGPPAVGKTRLKFFYATQVATRPPSFVLFANRPQSVHFSYRRFLINRFKETFGLDLVPIKLFIKSRHEDRPGGGKK